MSDYDAIAAARSDALEDRNYADITNLPPGFIEGFNVSLDTEYHVTFSGGSTSVEGRQVTINQPHQIVDDDFVGGRLGPFFYYVYLDSLGDYKVDRIVPQYSDRYLYYAHPLFTWRAIGKIWVDDDDLIKYASGDIVGVSTAVTVAAYDADEIVDADYKCTGENDQIFINMAIDFMSGAYDGGRVNLSAGTFNTTGEISLLKNIQLKGSGDGTIIKPSSGAHDAIEVAGDPVPSHIPGAEIRDLKIARETPATGYVGIDLDNATEVVVDNVTITGEYSGINSSSCTNAKYNNINIIGFQIEGLVIQGDGSKLTNIVIDGDSVSAPINRGLYCLSAINMSNITVKNINSTATCICVDMAASTVGSTLSDVTISDCETSKNLGSITGLQLFSDGSIASNVTISNIEATGTSGVANGIYVTSDNCNINNYLVTGCTGTGSGYGVNISAGSERTVLSGGRSFSNDTDFSDSGTDTTNIQGGNVTVFPDKVGIGVSPTYALDAGVSGSGEGARLSNAAGSGLLILDGSTDNGGYILLQEDGNNRGSIYYDGGTNCIHVYNFAAAAGPGNGFMARFYDSGVIRMGNPGYNTDYLEIEADGTVAFKGAATVWKDINLGGAIFTQPAASIPDVDEFKDLNGDDTGIPTYAFAIGEKVTGVFEMQHDYKEGSAITFHVHWQGIAAPSGTDYVKWELTYTIGRDATVLQVPATISGESAYDTQYEVVRTDLTAISDATLNIGDQVAFTLERVAAAGDAYAGDALMFTLGIHYEVDTVGSRTISAK